MLRLEDDLDLDRRSTRRDDMASTTTQTIPMRRTDDRRSISNRQTRMIMILINIHQVHRRRLAIHHDHETTIIPTREREARTVAAGGTGGAHRLRVIMPAVAIAPISFSCRICLVPAWCIIFTDSMGFMRRPWLS